MADMRNILALKGSGRVVYFAATLFLVGFGLKAALVPFHAWLPDAHPSAPAPISAMLSGVVIKTLGVYALVRVLFDVLGLGDVQSILTTLMVLGTISMIVGGFLAIGQSDMKRMLAYSSISQIGYVVFGIGIGTRLGILGALFYLICHAVFKSLLFLNSGAVVYSTGNRNLTKMGGLGRRMPVTGVTSLIASLSISGIPPFAGFFSKLIIIVAAVQAGHVVFAILAVLVSIITLAYYLKMQRMAFFGALGAAWEKAKEAPVLMCISMVILAVLCLALGAMLIPSVKAIFLDPAVNVLRTGAQSGETFLGI
jgi:multicomponent Na+:H+ antiporter subunit D